MIPEIINQRLTVLSAKYRALRVYALVDGVHWQRYTGERLESSQNHTVALFAGTKDEPLAYAGPWLVTPGYADKCGVNLLTFEQACFGALWLISWLDIDIQAEKLRSHLNVTLPDGKVALLRFWDPRVLPALNQTFQNRPERELFRAALEWHYLCEGQQRYINDHA